MAVTKILQQYLSHMHAERELSTISQLISSQKIAWERAKDLSGVSSY